MSIAPLQLTPTPRELSRAEGVVAVQRGFHIASSDLPESQTAIASALLQATGIAGQAESALPLSLSLSAQSADLVPEAARREYYELGLQPHGANLRAPAWDGMLCGLRTLADIVRQGRRRDGVPAMQIRDWPELPDRGIFVEDKWGPDRMTRADWFTVVDRLAALKLNRLGIGLYGCWGSCRYEPGPSGAGWPTEFLMVPVPGYPQLRSPKRLRWYSPAAGAWRDESYLPRMFTEDFLGDVVAYARERGVTVIPFVNSLGHNTLIPRLVPEVSAKGMDGSPLGIGYCLSDPVTRSFIEHMYGTIIDRYFDGSAPFFHVQMDEVWADNPYPANPNQRVEPWCQCERCRKLEREELLQDYVAWLVEMLTNRGVKKVVLWNDQLTRHMDALDQSFVGRLRERGLADRMILHWWWYSNDQLHDRTRVAIGRNLGLRGWVAPMTCYFNWQMYSPRHPNIELMLGMAHEEGAEGAVSYAVHDPGWSDHEALLASYAWNPDGMQPWSEVVDAWAQGRFGKRAPQYLDAAQMLRAAAATPALNRCHAYTYTYSRPNLPFPRAYPAEALDALADMEDAAGQLQTAAQKAEMVAGTLQRLAAGADAEDAALLLSLVGEAARIRGLARVFAFLLELRLTPQPETPGSITACRIVRAQLRGAMEEIEYGKPLWVVPGTLQGLSMLLAFMDQLLEDLEELANLPESGERVVPASPGVRWALAQPWCREVDHG